MSRLLERLFLFLCAREILILFGLLALAASVPVVIEQVHFLRVHWSSRPGSEALEELEHLIDGLAGVLVAGGVFLESRETLRKMALHHKEETSPMQQRLNEVAHHNGMGLLLVGLFMEIGTALTAMPARLIDVSGVEKYIFAVCLAFTLVAAVILADLVKDFLRTYAIKPAPR